MTKQSVSLVLGSGGARGLAHIGVIHYLTEQGYDIRSISGSSMGALVGGIYATGKLDAFEEWIVALEKFDIVRLLDISFTLSKGGFVRGERIISTLKDLIGEHDIAQLPIRYTAVACDIKRQKEVWLNSGSLFDAIRASIAIPSLFTPVTCGERLLVDGGLMNPVPVTPTLSDKTDITIAVDVNAAPEEGLPALTFLKRPKKAEPDRSRYHQQITGFINNIAQLTQRKNEVDERLNSLEVLTSSFESMQALITRMQIAHNPPDILINIPHNICTFYQFHHAETLIEFGYQRTQARI